MASELKPRIPGVEMQGKTAPVDRGDGVWQMTGMSGADHDPLSPERIVPARVEPHEIGFINALIEGHEGLATMRTLDPERGLVVLWVPRGQWEDFQSMIAGLREEVSLAILDPSDPCLEGFALREWMA